jgi:hypothetical protein
MPSPSDTSLPCYVFVPIRAQQGLTYPELQAGQQPGVVRSIPMQMIFSTVTVRTDTANPLIAAIVTGRAAVTCMRKGNLGIHGGIIPYRSNAFGTASTRIG